MIHSFLHKGLERYYKSGSRSGIPAQQERRIRLILTNLDQAESPQDMNLPGLALHSRATVREHGL